MRAPSTRSLLVAFPVALAAFSGCLVVIDPEGFLCPADLTLDLAADGTVEIDWTPVNISNGSNVWRSTDGGPFVLIANFTDNVTDETFDESPKTPGSTYTYTVRAVFDANESTECQEESVTIPGGTSSPPPTDIPFFPTATSVLLAAVLGSMVVALILLRRR